MRIFVKLRIFLIEINLEIKKIECVMRRINHMIIVLIEISRQVKQMELVDTEQTIDIKTDENIKRMIFEINIGLLMIEIITELMMIEIITE
jgi:hypothetical protein